MRQVISVNVGPVRQVQIGARKVATAGVKQPLEGAVDVHPLGLAGDEQADLSVHGGLSKAVYGYPVEHYPLWNTLRAQGRAAAFNDQMPPGSMGENLTLSGLLERDAWIGDVLRFAGGCELAVSEPRFPCHKFDAAMGFKHASKMMVQSGTCGFYLAVRVPAPLRAGETFDVIAGPRQVGIDELFRARGRQR